MFRTLASRAVGALTLKPRFVVALVLLVLLVSQGAVAESSVVVSPMEDGVVNMGPGTDPTG